MCQPVLAAMIVPAIKTAAFKFLRRFMRFMAKLHSGLNICVVPLLATMLPGRVSITNCANIPYTGLSVQRLYVIAHSSSIARHVARFAT